MTRVYPSNRGLGGNFDLFDGFAHGAHNSAMNMQWASDASKSVYAFADESAPGFAPPGFVMTRTGKPTRLGPPVFVTAISAPAKATITVRVFFDEALGMGDPPAVFARTVAQGLSTGTTVSTVADYPPESDEGEIELTLAAEEDGYEIFVTGPTASGLEIEGAIAGDGGTIWVSPTFDPVGLTPTGRCSTLGPDGRLFGAVDGDLCDASDNPSFVVEMAFE
ncbi:MAG: hypothetical protein M5R36_27575 [Deltaproteobacteria bacterium]|nr:hypothetical protein [Deltaproteobacteria bacterium]